MNFCLNCRLFGDPWVHHRDDCRGPIIVRLDTPQIGMCCNICGDFYSDKQGEVPHECCMNICRGQYKIPVYEYPKELRRS